MSKSGRFSWIVCALLVIALSGIILWAAAHENDRPIGDGLVRRTGARNQQSAQSPAPQASEAADVAHPVHPLDPALQIAREVLAKLRGEVDDYTGTIVKRERIAGSLGGEMRMAFKVRTRRVSGDELVRPLSVYLKVLDPWLSRGREVIWVENQRDGKLVAHEGGLKNLLTVSLGPTDTLAMMGNKYPITEIGLEKLVEKLIEKGERDKLTGPFDVFINSGYEVGGRPCRLIEVVHPKPDPRFDFHIARIFIDEERMIPLRYASYMWPEAPGGDPVLEEEYTYVDVQLNVGLQDIDFDPENPAYNFP